MAAKFAFELVSPERLLLSQEAEMVVVPGGDGNFGVLSGHIPLISTVRPGVIDVYESRRDPPSRIFVAGGFAEVTGGRCTVLADEAMPVSELDRAAIDKQVAEITEDLADAKDEAGRVAAERALAIARAKRAAALAA